MSSAVQLLLVNSLCTHVHFLANQPVCTVKRVCIVNWEVSESIDRDKHSLLSNFKKLSGELYGKISIKGFNLNKISLASCNFHVDLHAVQY